MKTTLRRLSLGVIPAAVLAVSGVSLAPAASASTTPPSSTAQQRTEALIQPSLVFVDTSVTGVVAVPTSDDQVEYLDVSKADNVGDYCSGAVVASSGTILSAGHCFYKGDLDYSLIEAIYNRLQQKGELTSGSTLEGAEKSWTVASGPHLYVSVAPMASASSVGNAQFMPTRVLSTESFSAGDVAVLQVNPAGQLPALQVAPANPADGINVVTAGFPGSATSQFDASNLEPTFTQGQTTSQQTQGAVPMTGISAVISQGMSGGPTVDMNGRILGTNSFDLSGSPADESQNYITSTEEIRRELAATVPTALDPADRAWRAGLADYFTGKYREAVTQFNTVLTAMPGDLSAQQYKAKALGDYPLESTGLLGQVIAILAVGATVLAAAAAAGLVLLRRRRRHPAPAATATTKEQAAPAPFLP
jgi:serine protease Do